MRLKSLVAVLMLLILTGACGAAEELEKGDADDVLDSETTSAPATPASGHGSVRWFNDQKGFGYIIPDVGGKDLFVSRTSINADGFRSLNAGDRVTFVAEQTNKGPAAVNVSLEADGPE